MGVVRKLEMWSSESRINGDLDLHYDSYCVGCGRYDDVRGAPTDFAGANSISPSGCDIIGHQVEFARV